MSKIIYVFLLIIYPATLIISAIIKGGISVGSIVSVLLSIAAVAAIIGMAKKNYLERTVVLLMGCAALFTSGFILYIGANIMAVLALGAAFLVWYRIVSHFKRDFAV